MTIATLEPATTISGDQSPMDLSRSRMLRASTHSAHEALDARIMEADPFASRSRYLLLVEMHYLFHREIAALYADPVLAGLLPDLTRRGRLALITQDLADLGATPPASSTEPVFTEGGFVDVPEALGWLYVAEGSKLGAAFLLKGAEKLALSGIHGARHLEAPPEGRGLHWKTFTAVLDAQAFDAARDARLVAGAQAAFACVQRLADACLPYARRPSIGHHRV